MKENLALQSISEDFLKQEERKERWRGEGEKFEEYLFGVMDIENLESFKKEESAILGEHANFGKIVPNYKAKKIIELVKKHQKNVFKPNSRFAGDLLEQLKKDLNIGDKKERLGFSTTVAKGAKTAVDVKLGIDAFFTFIDDSGVEHLISIDATTNTSEKLKSVGNADIILGPENIPDPNEEPREYIDAIKKLAQIIIDKINKKIERSKEDTRFKKYEKPASSMAVRGRKSNIVEYIPKEKR